MAATMLTDRLAALDSLTAVPRVELDWLVAHGRLETFAAEAVVAPKGQRIEKLWIILSGRMSVLVDRGAGPKRVMVWYGGEVSGMLPYSRMSGPPGDGYCEEPTELLTVHEQYFREMISACPTFTAYAVHLMLDRARGFSASDLHDEKMVSLGKLAAGLAHELNNPASATIRGARRLGTSLDTVEASARALRKADLSDDQLRVIDEVHAACEAGPSHDELPSLERADREDQLAAWLETHGASPDLAGPLTDTAATTQELERLAAVLSGPTLDAAIRWIADSCAVRLIASTIETAGARIDDLVAAVKRFTYMDALAAPESVDVTQGLRDTIQVLASKTGVKQATITVEVQPGLPRVCAAGGELNQVWFHLLDNALDAVAPSGHVALEVYREGGRVVVDVADNGPGIPPELMAHIFDPFFTTKPPGQGTGLGLDITRRILRRNRGDVTVTSTPGRTAFRVSLPMES